MHLLVPLSSDNSLSMQVKYELMHVLFKFRLVKSVQILLHQVQSSAWCVCECCV